MRRDDGYVYLFQHVPKCAGRTIEHQLEQSFPGASSVTLNFKARTKAEVMDQLLATRPKPRKLRSIQGHRVYYGIHEITGREPRYFTFLRDPVDAMVSLYNFFVDKPERSDLMYSGGDLVRFQDFIEQPAIQNNLTRQLAHSMVGPLCAGMPLDMPHDEAVAAGKQFLDACWFVGFVDRFDVDYQIIADVIGLPPRAVTQNVSNRHFAGDVTRSSRDRVLELNALDVELYEYARDRHR